MTPDDIKTARDNLTSFIMETASKRSRELGFGWIPSPVAPDSYDWLNVEFSLSCLTGQPLRVSSENCEGSVYSSEYGNYAFRFWHDLTHMHLNRSFEIEDELAVSEDHLREVFEAGMGYQSLEYRLMRADSYGQTYCYQTLGRFPMDQLQFALWTLSDGLEEAVAFEASTYP